MSASTTATAASRRVLSTISNLPRRTKGTTTSKYPLGKENIPPALARQRQYAAMQFSRTRDVVARLPKREKGADGSSKWAAKDGRIIIKVLVPSTDDIWKLRVAEDVTLEAFRKQVKEKIGFSPVFWSGSVTSPHKVVGSEEEFRKWVETRVVNSRNHPIIAARIQIFE